MDTVARRLLDRYLHRRRPAADNPLSAVTQALLGRRGVGVLDAWNGDTVTDEHGRTWFRNPVTGKMTPALAGGGPGYVEPLDVINADGTQVSNTVTETIVCPDYLVPAAFMQALPPRTLAVWAFGVVSSVVTTPGTLILRVRWGGVSGVVLLQSGAQGMDTTAHTNALWALLGFITCRTQGATGTFMSGGLMWTYDLLASTAANLLPALLGSAGAPGASGNVAVTVDTTVQKALSVTAQFSVATNPTNLTCQQRLILALN
jgi:hypothetical protein